MPARPCYMCTFRLHKDSTHQEKGGERDGHTEERVLACRIALERYPQCTAAAMGKTGEVEFSGL
jgi:hypothetical protein